MRIGVDELRELIRDAVANATTIGSLQQQNEMRYQETIRLKADLRKLQQSADEMRLRMGDPQHHTPVSDRCQVHGGLCDNPEHHSR